MRFTHFLAIMCAVIAISACQSKPVVSELHDDEKRLGTEGSLTKLFHSVIYYPDEISLQFPGYILGVEKIPVENVTKVHDVTKSPKEVILTTKVLADTEVDDEDFFNDLVDIKTMTVTHVLHNQGNKKCVVYNAYTLSTNKSIKQCHPQTEFSGNLYEQSWQAMGALRKKLVEDIAGRRNNSDPSDDYSHIVVLVMGWNTDQEEAVRNYNSIMGNLRKASQSKINPLFIGVTWPSMWNSSVLDIAAKAFSYPVKAKDADELGLSWLGVLIHQTINGLDVPKSVVIGHSFGARATSIASCVGPAITPDGEMLARGKVDLLIGLQGAYSINRFFPGDGWEKPHYNGCDNVKKIVLTSSSSDSAVGKGVWAPFVGGSKTYGKFCNLDEHADFFSCQKVDETGKTNFIPTDKRVVYLNADELIKFNAFRSGGGAHSDIYRLQMGELLWSAIKSFTPTESIELPIIQSGESNPTGAN